MSMGAARLILAVPQQVLITPTMNFGVMLLAFALLSIVLLLRGELRVQPPGVRRAS